MDLKFPTVGVVGAGLMGQGLAQVLAETGHAVTLVDIDECALGEAKTRITRSLKLAAMMNRIRPSLGIYETVGRITFTRDLTLLASAKFIVENVTEDLVIKSKVYRALDRLVGIDCVIAANTSAIPIGSLAAYLTCRSRLIGMHFMNPVPQKAIVEVIRSSDTSEDTVRTARAFLAEIGKDAIVVNDSPGFVTNRVLMLTINEAIALVHEGVASAADIDRIFVGCFAHKMGPLATADLIGLDTIKRSLEVLQQYTSESRFAPNPLLAEMVAAGILGRKSGIGFFEYKVRA
ncbi:3-hydroxybutyryl-CoA dehydrogenase [Sphingomonas sp. SORGH_AS 950]|uniref:3-hydroxyacyl-CoA dehydrogenase family protein n=1 Tax=Sphingomonas sp. SORGH_AS_0950 TaxID=3041792 RepID=UPI00278A5BDA|nr:3-hydroxyacyl-CoA dehydrogenase family protein [Sphingomonas sp. SORGH_AS_0950]MDQ1159619.1 3-hydroxybutyryl-CoA dehydrogenase [Sphingomonas sp. SORGH_AS_0950]